MYYKRQQYPDFTTLFQFLNNELSLPCLPSIVGLIRVFNALPSDIKFDVYVDEILLASELKYKQFSYSIAISTLKSYKIKVFDSNKPDSPLIETQIQIPQGHVFTINIVGNIQNPQIFILTTSSNQPTYSDRALIRYANLYDGDITVNVVKSKNVISTTMVKAKEVSKYSIIAPGTYQFQFKLTDSAGNNPLSSTIYEIKSTRIYTFYLVGSSANDPNYPLELVITVDVMTLIKQCPPMMNRFL